MTHAPLLAGKRFLVTGGTRGLGRAISLDLARHGADVFCNYLRNESALKAMLEENQELASKLHPLRADLSRSTGVERVKAALIGEPLHGMIHCAVTGIHKPLDELTMRHWDWTQAVNLRAFFELVRELTPLFEPASSVVALSSEGAERAAFNYAIVGATKGGLEALCRHLALELRARQIRVNTISAGSVVTSAWDAFPDRDRKIRKLEETMGPEQRLTAAQVAEVVTFLCSDASIGINAQTIVVDRGERLFR